MLETSLFLQLIVQFPNAQGKLIPFWKLFFIKGFFQAYSCGSFNVTDALSRIFFQIHSFNTTLTRHGILRGVFNEKTGLCFSSPDLTSY